MTRRKRSGVNSVLTFSDTVDQFATIIGDMIGLIPKEAKEKPRPRRVRTVYNPLLVWLADLDLDDFQVDGKGNLLIADGNGRVFEFTPTSLTCHINRLKLNDLRPEMAKYGESMHHVFSRKAGVNSDNDNL